MIEFRGAYSYDRDLNSRRSRFHTKLPSVTRQEFKDDADINKIVERVLRGEVVPQEFGSYGDFTGVASFQDAMNQVMDARAAFDALPARVRSRFHNNPAALVDFLSDEGNLDEAVRLGLVKPEKEESGGGRVGASAGADERRSVDDRQARDASGRFAGGGEGAASGG